MIYLDYAANTPVREEVLETFAQTSRKYIANPNSSHRLGLQAKMRLEESTLNIKTLLGAPLHELIYTSCASESNNLAIKGVAKKYKKHGKHIITTYLEHASVTGAMEALANEGFEIDYVDIAADGLVDLEHLSQLLRLDTILVSICAVDSEIGISQSINKIGNLLTAFPHCFFHVDGTQAVGKIPVLLDNIDLFSFAPHKFYGLNGCGALLKKETVLLEPLIHGGISTTPYRSGTPALGQIASMESALSLAMDKLDQNLQYVSEANSSLIHSLQKFPQININSTLNSTPFILNISLPGINTQALQADLEKQDIYLSNKSACCAPNSVSRPVYALTKNKKAALATLRISLSHLTTKEELQTFLYAFSAVLQTVSK